MASNDTQADVAQRLAEADAAAAAAKPQKGSPKVADKPVPADVKDPVVPEVKAKVVEKVSLRAVHGGPMINPFTNVTYTSAPSEPILIDGWDQSQIDALKLEVVPSESQE